MNIQDTGIRGYLKWLQRDQPGIYKAIAPQIAQYAPEAFSDYEQSQAMGSLMGLGDGLTTFFGTDSSPDPSTDVASAANSGASSPSITSMISNLVGAASQAYLAKTQVDNLKAINNIQLQRAQMNLSPLDTSSLTLGVPQVNVGLSKGTLTGGGIALAVGAGLALLFLLSGKRHRG
jgi:hypothetical protein